jgi:hypothetical protein
MVHSGRVHRVAQLETEQTKMKRRISRPCYDKMHRCPGWAGGGWKCPKVDRCDNGRINIDYDKRFWTWRFWSCDNCNVLILPYVTRWLDPTWVWWKITRFTDFWREPRHNLRYLFIDLRWHLWRKRKWKNGKY